MALEPVPLNTINKSGFFDLVRTAKTAQAAWVCQKLVRPTPYTFQIRHARADFRKGVAISKNSQSTTCCEFWLRRSAGDGIESRIVPLKRTSTLEGKSLYVSRQIARVEFLGGL
jgi:hypothetical protein